MAKKQERIPLTGQFGRGADAFFGPETEEEEKQVTGKPVQQEAGKVGIQQDSNLVEQLQTESYIAGKPVNQQNSIPVYQDTSKQVHQEAGKPEFMKATYYITSEQDMKLERIRLIRRQQGVKVDKSALIREAIDYLLE
jgi:hypothetical protein